MLWLPSLDTLLTLPFFSVLLAPSVLSASSLSTSLNLFLFYLTWTTIVWSYSPIVISLVATLAVRFLFYVVPCLVFLGFDAAIPSVAQSIKARGQRALPHRAAAALSSRGSAVQQQAISLSKLVGVGLLNIALSVLLQVAIDWVLTAVLQRSSALRVTAAYPLPWSLAKDLTRAFVARNTLAYYVHRFVLHSDLRQNQPRGVRIAGAQTLTRWHKTWHHSLKTSMPFAAAYDHPAAFLLGRWLPAYAPAFVFRMHMLSWLVFCAFLGLEEAFAHSGYNVLPSTIMLQGAARRQEAHLESGGEGNFGPWGVLDWLHSTSLGRHDVMDDLRDEAEKRDVKGKMRDARDDVGGKLQQVGQRVMNNTGDAAQDESRARRKRA